MTAQLRNMGLITPEVAAKLGEMQKAGASTVEIWDTLEKSLGRFNGAMKETENTANGAIGALQSAWDDLQRSFGEGMAKQMVGTTKDLTKQLRAS